MYFQIIYYEDTNSNIIFKYSYIHYGKGFLIYYFLIKKKIIINISKKVKKYFSDSKIYKNNYNHVAFILYFLLD